MKSEDKIDSILMIVIFSCILQGIVIGAILSMIF